MRGKSVLALFFVVVFSCTPKVPEATHRPTVISEEKPLVRPRNVILMIGDGMGLGQITAALYANGNHLNLEEFPVTGLQKPYSSDDLITDSAAGATAFASGVKTYNGAIGVNPDTLPLPTILEEAEQRGLATGLIATSEITHATPAAFYAHQKNRRMMEEIAADLLDSGVDFFVGGGKKYFDRRKDGRNLYVELAKKNYALYDFFLHDLDSLTPDPSMNFGFFTADSQPVPYAQGRDYLVSATRKALEFLPQRSDKGFFLMVEGSQIDWGGHANDTQYIISETLEFDRAVGAALEFARQDRQTLVIVTADHETGGFAIQPQSTMDSIVGAFTTDYHTAALVPVFAYGPGAELFSGLYENTAIYDKMRLLLGLDQDQPAASSGK